MLNDLPPEKVQELKEMYDTLMENEEIYFAYPGLYGMVGDWFQCTGTSTTSAWVHEPRTYDDPMRNREEYHVYERKGVDRAIETMAYKGSQGRDQ